MARLFYKRYAVLILVVLILCSLADARNNRKLVSRAKLVARLEDLDCMTTKLPRKSIRGVLQTALREVLDSGVKTWGDRGFAFDLNGDGKKEYLVLLECSAVGNCSWGVFALGPARLLGIIDGQSIYIHSSSGYWPLLTTYGHISASEGVVSTYKFKKGHYVKMAGDFEVSAYRNDYPKSMEKAPELCHSKTIKRTESTR